MNSGGKTSSQPLSKTWTLKPFTIFSMIYISKSKQQITSKHINLYRLNIYLYIHSVCVCVCIEEFGLKTNEDVHVAKHCSVVDVFG